MYLNQKLDSHIWLKPFLHTFFITVLHSYVILSFHHKSPLQSYCAMTTTFLVTHVPSCLWPTRCVLGELRGWHLHPYHVCSPGAALEHRCTDAGTEKGALRWVRCLRSHHICGNVINVFSNALLTWPFSWMKREMGKISRHLVNILYGVVDRYPGGAGLNGDYARHPGCQVAPRPPQGWDLHAARHQAPRGHAHFPQEDHHEGGCPTHSAVKFSWCKLATPTHPC